MDAVQYLTNRFYEWEQRGRGWHLLSVPVDLEPAFHPFFGHFLPPRPGRDDSRKHTFFSRFMAAFKDQPAEPEYESDFPETVAYPFTDDEPFLAFQVSLPRGADADMGAMQDVFLMLSDTLFPVSFEIQASHVDISLFLVCRITDAAYVRAQLEAYYPDARILEATHDILRSTGGECAHAVEFGLADECMLPLRMPERSDTDPYVGLFAALDSLGRGERILVQVLFQGVKHPWAESMLRAVCDNEGKAFFTNAPEMPKQAKEKVDMPLFAACVRVLAFAPTERGAEWLCERVGTAIVRTTGSQSNRLIVLSDEGRMESLYDDIFRRQTHRLGMLINSGELAILAHIPSEEVGTAKFGRDTRKTRLLPDVALGHKFVIGINEHAGERHSVSIPAHLRLQHTHIIGATGTGKSSLLVHMVTQDMLHGEGCAVLDPHGDLIESILERVPEYRTKDVVLVDPADGEFPVAFNILSAHSDIEKETLSTDLVAAFRRLSMSWGDQMNSVLANAILAFLESSKGGTLADLRRFLVEKPYRDAFLGTVEDPHVVYYWQKEYPLLRSNSIGSILTRLDSFLRPKLIRNMVAQKKGLDIEGIMNEKKILLVKLSQGLIGEGNSHLLGTFFVAKMYQAAMARQATAKANRTDFFLYIDEFHNFATPSLSQALTGTRKYHLGLIVSHQDMAQLSKYDSELGNAAMAAATRVCFRLVDTDAKRFASGFSYFDAMDLENLKRGQAICRLEQSSLDFTMSTISLRQIPEDVAESTAQTIISLSREKYGTPKAEAEKLQVEMPVVKEEPKAPPPPPPVTVSEPLQPEPPAPPVSAPEQTTAGMEEIIAKIRKPKSAKPETQHRYLQKLIQKIAQARGYKATLEVTTPDGKGRVDVSLERDGVLIACEVSVSTTEAWEAHNVEKCLTAGYSLVIVCSNDPKHLLRIQEELQKRLTEAQLATVLALEPDAVLQLLEVSNAKGPPAETIMKGYRIKVEYGKRNK